MSNYFRVKPLSELSPEDKEAFLHRAGVHAALDTGRRRWADRN